MILLDTDVVSQGAKTQPNAEVMAWFRSVPAESLYLSVITIHEVRAGAEMMQVGRKRRAVEDWLERDLLTGFADRTLPIDARVADLCGRMVAGDIRRGHSPELEDVLIAATARVHGLKLATLNWVHFKDLGVELVEF